MIRTIVTPDKEHISLSIPKNYIGVEIEVIAFSREETPPLKLNHKRKATFNSVSLDTRGFIFDRDSRDERLSLEEILQRESKAVHASSLEVLKEFECIDDELQTI